jgi:predicted HicB family RNase H-like nuclease
LIHIRLKPETHKRLRVRAAEEDVSIQDWVETLILTGLAAPISDNAPRRNLP